MGKHKRTTNRQSWNEDSMRNAIKDVHDGKMGYLKASKVYGVPRSTLEGRVSKVRRGLASVEKSAEKGLGYYKPVFNELQEQELVEHILIMESQLLSLSLNELRRLAFAFAERNGLDHPFSKIKKMAGKAWLYAFLKRHSELREPASSAVKEEYATEFVAVKEEWLQDEELSNIDCNGLIPKVEPEDEITIDDHCISVGEGSETELTSSWHRDMSASSCHSVYASPLPLLSDGMVENNNLGASETSTMENCNTEWQSKGNEETSSQHCADNFASYSKRSKKKSKKYCGLASDINRRTANNIHICTECGQYFTDGSYLKRHLVIHFGGKDHKCTECGKCFNQSGNLIRHLKIHTGEKNYKCTECGKSFTDGGNLKKHLSIHSGEKDYKCLECGKCFNRNGCLARHLKIHYGEKNYKCVECGKCFIDRSHLRKHLKIHSGEKDHKCAECGKGFSQSDLLKRHLSIHSEVESN